MLYLYISSALFVSFPEELLILITTLVASGYKNFTNLRLKSNIAKMLIATSLMVILSLTVNVFFDLSFRFLINTAIFYLIIALTYRKKFSSYILGFFLSLTVLTVSTFIFAPLFLHISGLSYEELYNSTFYKFIFSIPDRIFQTVALLAICKAKNINLKVIKFFAIDFVAIIIYYLMIAGTIFLLFEHMIYSDISNVKLALGVIINLTVVIGSSFLFINRIIDLRQKIYLKETQHDIELDHLKKLISDGQVDHAVDLINETLSERGYYKK